MAETTSQLRVQVSTPGLEQARRALEGLSKAATGATGDQAAQFTAATSAVQRMVAAVDQLTQRVDTAAASFGKMGQAAQGVGRATTTTFRGNAFEHIGQMGKGPTSAAMVARGNALAHVGQMSTAPASPALVARGNALDVLRQHGALSATRTAPSMNFAQRLAAGAGAFGLGAMQGLLPGQLGFVQRGAGALPQMLGMAAAQTAASFAAAPFRGTRGLVDAVGSIPLVGGLLSSPLSHYTQQAERVTSFQRQQMELAPLLGAQALRADGGMGTNMQAMRAVGPPAPPLTAIARVARDRAQVGAVGNDALRLMGMDVAGGQAFKGALAQTSGLDAATLQRTYPGFMQTAMAAQSNLGLSPQTTGQFALGARTNAFAGQRGASANDMLMRAINQAQQVSGSEPDQQNYLRMIAEGIQTFEQTGIPIKMDSIRDLTVGFQGLGLSTQAAQRAAMTTQGRAASFGENGPMSSLDMQIMQREGFRGGLPNMLRTRRKLSRDPDAVAADTMAIAAQNAQDPDKDIAIDQVTQILKTVGVTNPDDIDNFVNQARQGKAPDLAGLMAKAQKAPAGISDAAFAQAAAGGVPEAVRNAAQTTNLSIASSMDSAVIASQLDSTSSEIMSAFARYFGVVKNLSGSLMGAAQGATGSVGQMGIGPPAVRAGN